MQLYSLKVGLVNLAVLALATVLAASTVAIAGYRQRLGLIFSCLSLALTRHLPLEASGRPTTGESLSSEKSRLGERQLKPTCLCLSLLSRNRNALS